jgi:UDP-N-acetylmuramyl-tripeptide synthetase
VRIGDLIHGLDVRIVGSDPGGEGGGGGLAGLRICDITEDSRTVMPGSLFIARQGEKVDGKKFVGAAVKAGAVAVLTDDPAFEIPEGWTTHPVALLTAPDIELAAANLAERFYGDPSSKLAVIGVTGTNGKTTTTFLIHQMLNALGIRCGLIGTVVIDDGVEVAPASLTTPPAIEISRTFARMHEAGCKAAVMEVSSHALDQRRVGAIKFNAGVFTNLTGDHLDYHGTMEEYAAAKARLFAMLPSDGAAVVNIQDQAHSGMVKGSKARIVRCAVDAPTGLAITGGTAPETVCRARVVGADTSGTDVEFTGPWGHRRSHIPLVGAFNVMNALQAVATVHALFGGTDEDAMSFEIIAGALERAHAPPGRLEPVTKEGEPIQVFVDYAHSDDALQTVLKVLRGAMGRVPRAQLWCVFGCGGDRDRTKRPRMGKVAAELADRVVITSDNPRTENPDLIIAEIQTGISRESSPKVVVEPDREAAIRLAIKQSKPGDTIVIAGKGHEDYQILPDGKGGTVKRHFDDREVARAALKERGIAVREPQPARTPEADDSVIG